MGQICRSVHNRVTLISQMNDLYNMSQFAAGSLQLKYMWQPVHTQVSQIFSCRPSLKCSNLGLLSSKASIIPYRILPYVMVHITDLTVKIYCRTCTLINLFQKCKRLNGRVVDIQAYFYIQTIYNIRENGHISGFNHKFDSKTYCQTCTFISLF